VATTVGSDVVLGASLALTAQIEPLEQAYGDFKREALRLKPNCAPTRRSTWMAGSSPKRPGCLYMERDFHGHRVSAHLLVRLWALLHNFQPYCPRARLRSSLPFNSPFHKLNGFTYRSNWLENLLVASSIQVEHYHQIR
jgi:hypothetical protein